MKTLIALHGNPGSPQDWKLLQTMIGSRYEFKSVDTYSETWAQEVRRGEDKKIILAHSWGAYRILKLLPELKNHVEKVILVAPYVNVERPLSGLARGLLKIPYLGTSLIKANHRKSKDAFVSDLLFPNPDSTPEVVQALKVFYADWKVWQKTVTYKIKMQQDPWTPADIVDQIPITVLYGKDDKISQAESQNSVLAKYPQAHIKIIPGAGHGMLWSHPEEILSEL